jgi:hypothetical protein
MPIQEFELYHGAVLTKVMRTDPMPTLRLIEKDQSDAWGSYRVNDAVILHIKHATVARTLKRAPGVRKWTFTFPPAEVAALARDSQVYVALVCGRSDGRTKGEICLLKPDEVLQLLDASGSTAQTITVESEPAKELRAHSTRDECDLKVPRNRIDTWRVPGS